MANTTILVHFYLSLVLNFMHFTYIVIQLGTGCSTKTLYILYILYVSLISIIYVFILI